MNHMLRPLLLLAVAPLPAQDQATTLSLLCDAAEAVVVATVTSTGQPTPDFLRVVFHNDATLRGNPEPAFNMIEPASACCGRALFALQPAQQVLLFLHHRGPAWHVLGDGRGAMPAAPALITHVQALLAAADANARAMLLFTALAAAAPRVRADAALALATMHLPSPDAAGRAALADAVRAALTDGSALLPSLLQTAAMTGALELVPDLVLACLHAPEDDRASLLRTMLARMPATDVTMAVAAHWPTATAARLRAVDLLAELSPDQAAPLLQRLLRESGSIRVASRAAAILLAQGVPRSAFTELLPAPLLDAAVRAAAAPPRLHCLRPRTQP